MPPIILPSEVPNAGQTGGFAVPRPVTRFDDQSGAQFNAFGRALEGAGLSFADLGDEIQSELDTARANRHFTLWESANSKALFSEQGFMNLKGEAAMGEARQRTMDRIATTSRELEAALENPVQKGKFRQRVDQRLQELDQMTLIHQGREVASFRIGEAEATEQMQIQTGVELESRGLEGAENHLRTAIDAARVSAKGRGLGEEQTRLRIQETTTKFHSQVVANLLSTGEPERAAAYLAGVPAEDIEPGRRNSLQDAVRRGSLNERAALEAEDIILESDETARKEIRAQEPDPIQGSLIQELQARAITLTPDELLITAWQRMKAKNLPADLEDATWDRIKAEISHRKEVVAIQRNRLRTEVETFLGLNPDFGLTHLPPETYEALLRSGMFAEMADFADNKRYTNDPDTANTLELMSDSELIMPREIFLDMIRGKLDPTRNRAALARWNKANNQATADDESVIDSDEMIRRRAASVGILRIRDVGTFEQVNDNSWPSVWRIEDEVQRRVNVEKVKTGKAPAGQALEDIVGEVFADDYYNSTGRRLSESTRAEVKEAFQDTPVKLAEIPLPVYAHIRNRLRTKGQPDGATAVLRLWLQMNRPKSVGEIR